MTKTTKNSEVLKNFAELKNREITESADTLKNTIYSIFKEMPEVVFLQSDFADRLGKRTQHVNHILRELVEENKISKTGSRRQYYYRFIA